jgi:LysM repeat protein
MRRGLSNIFFVLLVLAVILGGLTGCTRSVEERVTEDEGTSGAAPTATEAGGAVVAPGQTVVSAVTQETGEQEGETPAGATDVASSAGTDQATAEATATPTTGTSVTPVPEATQAPGSGSSDETVIHVVQSGETLTTIARSYGTTVQAITQANNITNPSLITPGQNLVIPVSGSSGSSSGGTTTGGCRIKHIVKPGEWIWQIARNYGVDPQDILDSNGMRLPSASIIQPGQELCIP